MAPATNRLRFVSLSLVGINAYKIQAFSCASNRKTDEEFWAYNMYLVIEHVLHCSIRKYPKQRRRMALEQTEYAALPVDLDARAVCTTP